mmetsp:Transcript_69917/g.114652  ORF Transcript_69917/g.114652 Transcript_69917/m.114652 type:complete len:86 (-) Transcript_69917:963-1220(-)
MRLHPKLCFCKRALSTGENCRLQPSVSDSLLSSSLLQMSNCMYFNQYPTSLITTLAPCDTSNCHLESVSLLILLTPEASHHSMNP